jgi:CheY-like chemotaxis protein
MANTEEVVDVLVIDDDEAILHAFVSALEEEGIRVAGVTDGLAALEFLKEAPVLPKLLLLDLMMPVMNGYEFRTEQLRDPRLAQIPVIIVTARGDAFPAGPLGDVGFLRKPVRLQSLLALVQSHMARP